MAIDLTEMNNELHTEIRVDSRPVEAKGRSLEHFRQSLSEQMFRRRIRP